MPLLAVGLPVALHVLVSEREGHANASNAFVVSLSSACTDELEVLVLRVLELRVREPAQGLNEQHHRRDSRPRDLGGVVERARRQPMRRARDLADRLVGELEQPVVEGDRLDRPDPLPLDLDVLLAANRSLASCASSSSRASFARVEVALVEQLLGRLDDGGDDAGPADDAARRADRAVPDLRRDRPDLERELRRAGERVAALVHRRRAGVRGLAAPRDEVALDAEGAEDDAERQVERLEHRPLLDVELEVRRRVLELPPRLERAVEVDAVLGERVGQRDPVRVAPLRAARPGRSSSPPRPRSRRASGRSARPPRRPS